MAKPSFPFRLLIPTLLIILSMCCLIIVGMGMRSKETLLLQSLYFFRASTKNFTIDLKHVLDEHLDNTLLSDLENANLDDFYTIGFWNYCSGSIVNGSDSAKHCSPSHAFFSFDLKSVWASNLKDRVEENFPRELGVSLKVYQTVSRWTTASYLLGIVAAGLQLALEVLMTFYCASYFYVVGLLSMISTFFLLAASITVSAFYSSLVVIINKNLGGYGIRCTMGHNLYILIWLAAVSSLFATLFWAYELCCCTAKWKKNKAAKDLHFHSYQSLESRSDLRESQIIEVKEYKRAPKVIVVPPSATGQAYEPYRAR